MDAGKSLAVIILLALGCFSRNASGTGRKVPDDAQNIIEQPDALRPFFDALDSLQQRKIKQLEILHIGDSHLQADFFPQQMRTRFQQDYGNAGRGIVFPYRAAKTNESFLWQSSANGNFIRRRLVHEADTLPLGLAGMGFFTRDSAASITMLLRQTDSLNYAFRELRMVCINPDMAYLPQLKDTSGNMSNMECTPMNGFCSYKKSFSEPLQNIRLQISNPRLSSKGFNMHALILGDTASGVIYHSVGINGAEYRHYDAAPLFFEESRLLHPALIIFSLGTNEAYARNFSADSLLFHANRVIARLLAMHPNACVLITSPGDALKGRKYKNPNNLKAVKALRDYCRQKGYAFYNWYNAMGGAGSIHQWTRKSWAQKDKLHLTRAGYTLQGDMLYRAILKAGEEKP